MITLYWCAKSRSSRIVWMLEECGAEYEIAPINIYDEASKADPGFRRASPLGKVPALKDKEISLWDSAPICLYLADTFQAAKLAPPFGAPERASYYYWMTFAPGVIEPAMIEKVSQSETNKGRNGWGDYDSMVSLLETHLKDREWILGDHFSAADVMVGSSVSFLHIFGIMDNNAVLTPYRNRCLARPACQTALKLDEDPPT